MLHKMGKKGEGERMPSSLLPIFIHFHPSSPNFTKIHEPVHQKIVSLHLLDKWPRKVQGRRIKLEKKKLFELQNTYFYTALNLFMGVALLAWVKLTLCACEAIVNYCKKKMSMHGSCEV